MSDVICPRCGKPNRAAARFCVGCGQALAGAAPPPAAVGQRARQAVGQVAQAATPAVRQAAQAAAPVAGQVARRSWQASRQGMGWLARLVTGGGRAAYTEIVSPQPALAGQVVSVPTEDWVPAQIELGAIAFLAGLLLGWLVFLLPEWWQELAAILALALLLLGLNFAGLRRPAFTRMTWGRLLRRFRQVPRLRCHVRDYATNQTTTLTLVGPRAGGPLVQGADLLAYGIRDTRNNEVRAWKLDLSGATGNTVITAPRLAPLTVALLLVPLLLGLVWLIGMVIGRIGGV
jgi:hypothetical protein